MIERQTDEVLAIRAKEGDANAFEELFNRYKRQLLNYIFRIIGSKETAEEVALDVFMKAYKNLYLFNPDKKFSTWIYTIARNQARNAVRDKKYYRDVSLENIVFEGKEEAITLKDMIASPGQDPASIAESAELEEEAQKVLDSLPLEYREVITLCSVQGLTYKEAGSVLGLSTAGVALKLNKAKELFMKKLGIDFNPREK